MGVQGSLAFGEGNSGLKGLRSSGREGELTLMDFSPLISTKAFSSVLILLWDSYHLIDEGGMEG